MLDFYRVYFNISLAVSAIALLIAYALEYHYSLAICQLCWYQRYTFFAIIFFSLVGSKTRFARNLLTLVVTTLFISNFALAMSQVLTETGAISSPVACEGAPISQGMSFEEFSARIAENERVSCGVSNFQIFYISIAGYSMIINAAMMLYSLLFSAIFVLFRYDIEKATKKLLN